MNDTISMTVFVWAAFSVGIICLLIGGAINQYLHNSDARRQKISEQDLKIQSLTWRVDGLDGEMRGVQRSISSQYSTLRSVCDEVDEMNKSKRK